MRKVVSLSEAAKITGYHPDYLSALIRKKELNGRKVGKTWFTTEEALNDYSLKKKIRHKKFALAEFFSPLRTRNIFLWTGVIFLSGIILGIYIYGKIIKVTPQEGNKNLSPDVEVKE